MFGFNLIAWAADVLGRRADRMQARELADWLIVVLETTPTEIMLPALAQAAAQRREEDGV